LKAKEPILRDLGANACCRYAPASRSRADNRKLPHPHSPAASSSSPEPSVQRAPLQALSHQVICDSPGRRGITPDMVTYLKIASLMIGLVFGLTLLFQFFLQWQGVLARATYEQGVSFTGISHFGRATYAGLNWFQDRDNPRPCPITPASAGRRFGGHRLGQRRPPAGPEDYMREQLAPIAVASTVVHELSDGRFILVSCRPMPNGGWVTTHEDISERRKAENPGCLYGAS
jgi:PAS fold